MAVIWGRAVCFDSCIGRSSPFFPVVSSEGPRCNSNITAITFEGLNCQGRMMATTGRGAIKDEYTADCSLRFFFLSAAVAQEPLLPCGSRSV